MRLSPAFSLLALAALSAAASSSVAHAQNSGDGIANASSNSTTTSKEANSAATGKEAAVPVTIDDYIRAETDETFKRMVKMGVFGDKIFHYREVVPLDQQPVVRINRDTLYSVAVVDLDAGPVTVTLPKPDDGRFMSALLISEDHYMEPVKYAPAKFSVDKKEMGTRYAMIALRTFMNPDNASDVKAANEMQDAVKIEQKNGPGKFEVPNWNSTDVVRLREALEVLAATKKDTKGFFGQKGKIDEVDHLLGTAAGWGGNPASAAIYVSGVVPENDGERPYVLTVPRDVPLERGGFWSVTAYNASAFLAPNDEGAYSFNSITAAKESNGEAVIHFGGSDKNASNYLPLPGKGWTYTVRLYKPKKEVLDGKWKFPEAKEAPPVE